MRRTLVALFAIAVAAGCASSPARQAARAADDAVRPAIVLTQLSSVPTAARHVEGNLPIQFRMSVTNNAPHAIVLKSIYVQSVGAGAYAIAPTSRPFDVRIEPDRYETVEFWVPAFIESASIVGANGPVTVRAMIDFDADGRKFQETVLQQVNAMPGRTRQ